jgi:Protein kinase domain
MDSEKWTYAAISDTEYYFGALNEYYPHGNGIYFDTSHELIFADWKKGKLNSFYSEYSDEKYHKINSKGKIIIKKTIYSEIPVNLFDLSENRHTIKFEEDLLYKQGKYDTSNYSIQEFSFTDTRIIELIIKTSYILKLTKGKSHTLLLATLNYDYNPNEIIFAFITENFDCKLDKIIHEIKKYDNNILASIKSLVGFLVELHSKNIAHNDISLSSIVFILRSNYKLHFYSFFRALVVDPKDLMVDSFFTRSREFLAPEAYTDDKYNPFAADIYSIGLVALCVITENDLGRCNPQAIPEIIATLPSDYPKSLLAQMLSLKPSARPTINEVFDKMNGESETTIL